MCAAWNFFERALTCPKRRLSELSEVLTRDLRNSWEGLHTRTSSGVPTERNPSEFVLATEEAMQSALDVQSTFLDMSRPTTADNLPHSALELRRAETTISASQLEAHLQAASVEQLTENHDIVEQSACHVKVRGSRQRLRRFQPKGWHWSGLDTHVRG
jgi:hypothetical protein